MTKVDTLITIQHSSMQFSDPRPQQKHDANAVFTLGSTIVCGTEAAPGSGNDNREFLPPAAKDHGYRFFVPKQVSDAWVAVKEDFIGEGGHWQEGFIPILSRKKGPGGRVLYGPKGITWVEFDTDDLGRFHVGATHWPTHGRTPSDPEYRNVTKMAQANGEFGRDRGKGNNVVFVAADTNVPDNKYDVFRGAPFTTIWDETKHHENTGHGNIDIVAKYNPDGRVTGVKGRALNDKELSLFSDHFTIVATYRIKKIK